jgi:hypothetical protein
MPGAGEREAFLTGGLSVTAAHPHGGQTQQDGRVPAEQTEPGPRRQRRRRIRADQGDGLARRAGQVPAHLVGQGSGQEAGHDLDREQQAEHVEESYATDLLSEATSSVGYLLKDRVAHVRDFLDAVRRVAAGTDHRRVLAVLNYLGT